MNSDNHGAARTVVFIHSGYSVDIELAELFAGIFRKHGFGLEAFSLSDPQMPARFSALLANGLQRVYCFFSLNYYATQLRFGNKLLHKATGIPLVFFLADHPLYFLDAQSKELDGTIAYVPGRDLVDFVGKYFPPGTVAVNGQTFLPPTFPHQTPDLDDFLSRENKILCPMNLSIWGRSMDGVWRLIKELPEPRRKFVTRLIEATLTDCATPLHTIYETLPDGPDPEERQIRDARLALDFVKIWRRNHMVRALIDLPILVSSEYVPADLRIQYPEKFTLLSIQDTQPLYRKFRFVLNSFPLMTYAFHERAVKALFANSVLITDPNNRMRECLADGEEAVFYDYAATDNRARIVELLENPERAYRMTVNAHAALLSRPAFNYDSYTDLIAAVGRMRGAARQP